MKVTFASIFLNEAEYLERNLAQHYDFCDDWILVEGADRNYPHARVSEDGLSTDGTGELLAKFPDPAKKLRHVRHGWAESKSELRNEYAKRIEHDGIVIVFDIDEFLTRDDMATVLDLLRRMDGPGVVRIPHVHFWKDQNHIIEGGYYSQHHDRCYRWTPGALYGGNHNHPEIEGVMLRDKRVINIERRTHRTDGEKRTIVGPAFLHYGFVKKPENIADKNAYYINRGERTTRPETTRDRALWFAEELPPTVEVSEWAGPWPEVMLTEEGAR